MMSRVEACVGGCALVGGLIRSESMHANRQGIDKATSFSSLLLLACLLEVQLAKLVWQGTLA